MCSDCAVGGDRGQDRVVLEVVGTDADAGLIGGDAAGRVAGSDQVDPEPAVREDAVGQDAVAGSRLDAEHRPGHGRRCCCPGPRPPADRVVAGAVAEDTPSTSLPSRVAPLMSVPM